MGAPSLAPAYADWRRGRWSGGGGPSASGASSGGKRRDSPEKRAGKAVSIVESVGRLPPVQDHNTRWPRKAEEGGEEGMHRNRHMGRLEGDEP